MDIGTFDPASTTAKVIIIDNTSVRPLQNLEELRTLVDNRRFFWIDVVGGKDHEHEAILKILDLFHLLPVWTVRPETPGRLSIGPDGMRATTWLAEDLQGPTKVHILGTKSCLMTVWSGNAERLDHIRSHFAERAGGLEDNPFHAAAILLQLLLTTIDQHLAELDGALDTLHQTVIENHGTIEFMSLRGRLQRLRTMWFEIDRYSSAVRTAIVGIELLPGIDQRAATELNDYAQQVAEIEHRLRERSLWATEIMSDYRTAIAQRQGEQVNRLTVVSAIFLPLTFATGFFGMNFTWLNDNLVGPLPFLLLGLLLPLAGVIATAIWLRRRGLI